MFAAQVLRVAAACLLAGAPPGTSKEQPVTLVAVGDVCFAKSVAAHMTRSGRGWPFALIAPVTRGADIAVANLECVLARGGTPIANKKYRFRCDPAGAIALRDGGFRVATLANNHTLDFDKAGLVETIEHLDRASVAAPGGGRTLAEAHRLRVVTVRGLRVGFLAYLGMFPSVVPLREREPGVAMAYLPRMQADIRDARRQVDVLIVCVHAGRERVRTPTPRQREIAHAAVDAGADMVIGHHPHVVQPLEVYRGKPIFYSLGNFVFQPSPEFLRDGGRGWSAMVVATLRRGVPVRARLVDLRIVDGRPCLPRGVSAAAP
jgi:poly-gamma-glutamate capsule biosynthesis protein CapA/YwtB (metallophosphatase superfamily)